MYTSETILTFGKYKFMKLKNIPPEYFRSILKNRSTHDKELMLWILRNELWLEEIYTPPVPVALKCEKETYPAEKDARYRLKQIREKAGDNKGNKIPIRVYECTKCSGWHLTSKEVEEYEALVEKFKP